MTNSSKGREQNHRRSPRNKARSHLKVQCRKGTRGLGTDLGLEVLDLSENGIRLTISQSLELKTEVEIILEGYGMKGTIKRYGEVRWQSTLETGQICIGVEFQKRLSFQEFQTLAAPR